MSDALTPGPSPRGEGRGLAAGVPVGFEAQAREAFAGESAARRFERDTFAAEHDIRRVGALPVFDDDLMFGLGEDGDEGGGLGCRLVHGVFSSSQSSEVSSQMPDSSSQYIGKRVTPSG